MKLMHPPDETRLNDVPAWACGRGLRGDLDQVEDRLCSPVDGEPRGEVVEGGESVQGVHGLKVEIVS